MHTFLGNIRYAVRILAKSPGFTLTAVICLGLGVGVNTALFGIFDTLLWKPLPVGDPEELVRLFTKGPAATRLYGGFSFPEYEDYRRQADAFVGIVATAPAELGFRSTGSHAIRAFGEAVSDDYFRMLGLRPLHGRPLAPRPDGRRNDAAEVVVSHRFWKARLNADPGVVGRTVWLTGTPFTVVGIAPRGFNGTYSSPIFAPDLWLPLATLPGLEADDRGVLEDRGRRRLSLLARLRPGVDVARAQAALATIASRLERSYPASNGGVKVFAFRELDTHPEVYSSRAVNGLALLFLGLAGLVLVVACANLANLMLARTAARRKEIGLRLALGAGRGQVVRQLAAEALVLSFAASLLGLVIAAGAARAVSLVRLPIDLPIVFEVSLDVRALAFAVAVSLAAAAAFGVLPALRVARGDLVPALKGEARVRRRARRLTAANVLVVAQVAFSLVLLVTAGLFWRSVGGVRTIDPGIQLRDRTLVSFSPSILGYDAARTAAFNRAVLDRVRQAPAVENAGLVAWVPLGLQFHEAALIVRGDDRSPVGGEETARTLSSLTNVVSPAFFETAGIGLRKGRDFDARDVADGRPVVIVNETLARRAWPGVDPLGRQLRLDRDGSPWLTIVGVVADGKYRNLTEAPQSCLFRPEEQTSAGPMTLVMKARAGHAEAVTAARRAAESLDPDMPLLDVKTMDQQMAKVRFLPQAMTALSGPAAMVAILIAAIGLYGVLACSVSRRAREFGIRMAVGASPLDVVRGVMRQGLALVAVGLVLGCGAALGLSRVLRRVLVGVGPADPLVLLGALVLVAVIASFAIALPARRASRVDPLVALRQE